MLPILLTQLLISTVNINSPEKKTLMELEDVLYGYIDAIKNVYFMLTSLDYATISGVDDLDDPLLNLSGPLED